MKIPEQLAEEYAEFETQGVPDSIRKQLLMTKDKMAFLAGYKAAKDTFLAQFKSLLSSYAETSFNPNHTAWQIFDTLKGTQAAVNSPEKQDSCEHILDMKKMVDVNSSSNSNGWISVKERLPEVNTWCLWLYPTGPEVNQYEGKLDDGTMLFHRNWYDFEDTDITHWMPMPEPPKEEE